MKALMKVARGVGNVELREVPEPSPGPGQVVISVDKAGVCGTDIHIYNDEYKTDPPVIMGHEVAGTVASVGEGVTGVRIGQRVTTETFFSVCGTCPACRSGFVNLCPSRRSIGSAVDGGFAEYVAVPARILHELPDSVSFVAGALVEPVACCLHALELTHIMPGDVAVVSGPGPIGLIVAQLARASGAYVIVLGKEADRERLSKAVELGANAVVDVDREDPAGAVRRVREEGADVVFECSGAPGSASMCLNLVRRKGRMSQVGLYGCPVTLELDLVCYKELVVTGSNAAVPWVWDKAISVVAQGKVRAESLVTGIYRLKDWRETFDGLRNKSGIKLLFSPAS